MSTDRELREKIEKILTVAELDHDSIGPHTLFDIGPMDDERSYGEIILDSVLALLTKATREARIDELENLPEPRRTCTCTPCYWVNNTRLEELKQLKRTKNKEEA